MNAEVRWGGIFRFILRRNISPRWWVVCRRTLACNVLYVSSMSSSWKAAQMVSSSLFRPRNQNKLSRHLSQMACQLTSKTLEHPVKHSANSIGIQVLFHYSGNFPCIWIDKFVTAQLYEHESMESYTSNTNWPYTKADTPKMFWKALEIWETGEELKFVLWNISYF